VVPSFVPSVENQIKMVGNAGLRVLEVASFSRSELRYPASPKLYVSGCGSETPIVRGYRIQRAEITRVASRRQIKPGFL
jgi:hypothetical protein